MRRILIVEDDEDERGGLYDLMEIDGHQARAHSTSNGAYEEFTRFRPDAAIVDIGLPDSHGVELVYRLRQQAPHLFVVVVSGYLKKWDPDDVLDCGAELVLEKPYDIKALRRTLKELQPTSSPSQAESQGGAAAPCAHAAD